MTAEKSLLERCSVFAGGFDVQSACAVGGIDDTDEFAVLDLLDALVRKSLLVARSVIRADPVFDAGDDPPVRRGATRRTRGGSRGSRTAHAQHFADREAEIMALWDSPRQREAYDWFGTELANLRTAFRWAADARRPRRRRDHRHLRGLLGFGVENYEPVAWAEELIEPARAVGSSAARESVCASASLCWMAGTDRGGGPVRRHRSDTLCTAVRIRRPTGSKAGLAAAYQPDRAA